MNVIAGIMRKKGEREGEGKRMDFTGIRSCRCRNEKRTLKVRGNGYLLQVPMSALGRTTIKVTRLHNYIERSPLSVVLS